MKQTSEHRKQMEAMKLGDVITFPKSMAKAIRAVAVRMYCHGKTMMVTSERKDDFIRVERIE